MNIQKLYDKGWDWLIFYGPKILIAIIVFIVGEWFIKIIRKRIGQKMKEKKVRSSLRPFLLSTTFNALQVLLILFVMQIAGIQLTIFAAVLAALGAAVGFALSGTFQNFASGILILSMKPFDIGDNIIAQNQEGTVTSIQLFYTSITTFDNRMVILPNSKLSNEVIINVTREGIRRLDITFKFNYGIDFESIRKLIFDAVISNLMVINDPEIRIGINQFDPDGYICFINIWVKAHGFQDTKLILNEKILSGLKNGGIILPGMKA
jgi:small conductance mechanosensitive channel